MKLSMLLIPAMFALPQSMAPVHAHGTRSAQRAPAPQQEEFLRLRLLDSAGIPLPEGTAVDVQLEWFTPKKLVDMGKWFPPPSMFFVPQSVGADGQLTCNLGRFHVGSEQITYLHVGSVRSAASRIRAFLPWPMEVPRDKPLELKLEPERVLFAGRILDEQGQAIPLENLYVQVSDALPAGTLDAMRMLGVRVEPRAEGYAVLGWPVDGLWQISASYYYYGPESKPRPIGFGRTDVDIVLPAAGHVQVKVDLPNPFPQGALEAVYEHADGEVVSRQPIFEGTTNHRLRAGSHRMRVELAGETILDMGERTVVRGKGLDLSLQLPATLRVLRLSLRDPEGAPISAAQAHIVGGDEHFHFGNDSRLGLLVSIVRENVDLIIKADGFEPLRIDGLSEDRQVVLQRVKR